MNSTSSSLTGNLCVVCVELCVNVCGEHRAKQKQNLIFIFWKRAILVPILYSETTNLSSMLYVFLSCPPSTFPFNKWGRRGRGVTKDSACLSVCVHVQVFYLILPLSSEPLKHLRPILRWCTMIFCLSHLTWKASIAVDRSSDCDLWTDVLSFARIWRLLSVGWGSASLSGASLSFGCQADQSGSLCQAYRCASMQRSSSSAGSHALAKWILITNVIGQRFNAPRLSSCASYVTLI